MEKAILGIAAMAIAGVASAKMASAAAQEAVHVTNPTIVCAPCDGQAFGLAGTGMVLMDGSGNMYFYPLDRAAATVEGFGTQQRAQTAAQFVGRVNRVGAALVWAK